MGKPGGLLYARQMSAKWTNSSKSHELQPIRVANHKNTGSVQNYGGYWYRIMLRPELLANQWAHCIFYVAITIALAVVIAPDTVNWHPRIQNHFATVNQRSWFDFDQNLFGVYASCFTDNLSSLLLKHFNLLRRHTGRDKWCVKDWNLKNWIPWSLFHGTPHKICCMDKEARMLQIKK